jgi:hypothetical protein
MFSVTNYLEICYSVVWREVHDDDNNKELIGRNKSEIKMHAKFLLENLQVGKELGDLTVYGRIVL